MNKSVRRASMSAVGDVWAYVSLFECTAESVTVGGVPGVRSNGSVHFVEGKFSRLSTSPVENVPGVRSGERSLREKFLRSSMSPVESVPGVQRKILPSKAPSGVVTMNELLEHPFEEKFLIIVEKEYDRKGVVGGGGGEYTTKNSSIIVEKEYDRKSAVGGGGGE